MILQAGEGGGQIWSKLAAAVARKLLEPGRNLWIRSPKDLASSDSQGGQLGSGFSRERRQREQFFARLQSSTPILFRTNWSKSAEISEKYLDQ